MWGSDYFGQDNFGADYWGSVLAIVISATGIKSVISLLSLGRWMSR
jgi:hypothetical protein